MLKPARTMRSLRVTVGGLAITLFQFAVAKQVGIGKDDVGKGGKLQRRPPSVERRSTSFSTMRR